MTQKLSNDDPQGELSWEDAVARYLEDHPDYFDRHPEALARIRISHEVGGPAVSLIERQVQLLREREQGLQRQLRELVGIARENDALGKRLHQFALALLEARNFEDAIEAARELLRQEFGLEAVVVRLRGRADSSPNGPELVLEDDHRLAAVLTELASGKPLCGGEFDEGLQRYLFGERVADIRSCAIIPLGDKNPRGVLALGSHDPHRFHPGMGTVYLARLGDLLMQGLVRYLR
jgi:uncharacterized protein YigA (DUF484 family)